MMAKGRGRPKKVIVVPMIQKATPIEAAVEVNTTTKGTPAISQEARVQSNDTAPTSIDIPESSDAAERRIEVQRQPDLGKIPNQTEGEASRPAKRGMRLDYIAPTLKEGVPVACLQQADVESEALKWKTAVILYVVGETPTIRYLQTYLLKQCNIDEPEIFYHNDGYFIVRFKSMDERNSILFDGPHTIANRPVIVKAWEADFNFENEILKVIPLWIQLPNLPLNCWGGKSLSRIGSILGKPLFADECTTEQSRISYARLLIEIDVTQPIKHQIIIEDENGRRVEQRVIYDWVPPFCQKCQAAGHDCGAKQKPRAVQRVKQKWQAKPQAVNVVASVVSEKGSGKGTTEEEEPGEWAVPRKTYSHVVSNTKPISVVSGNTYQVLNGQEEGNFEIVEGGDLFPFVGK